MGLRTNGINLIYTVATGSRKVRMLMTPVVGLSYFLFASFFVLLSFGIDRWLNLPSFPPAPIHQYLGFPLLILGLMLAGWCVFYFLRARGTPVPFNPPPVLVVSGPYAHVRNPMLNGVFLFLFGLGLALQSPALLFIFTPLFIAINVLELKTIEEPELTMRLGQDYANYREKTPMFFPKIW